MSDQLNNMIDMVKYVLEKNYEARDNDILLQKVIHYNEYKTRMAVMSSETEGIKVADSAAQVDVKESIVELRSININIDGVDITISKQDVEKIMETFHRFDE